MDLKMTGFKQRFICDEMLVRLARWLRAAGYDTEVVTRGVKDRDLMADAMANDRLILTRDRKFLERRGADTQVFFVISVDIDEQVREITGPLGINWIKAPFSRCLMDNAPLRPASDAEINALPWPQQKPLGPFTTCPECGRHYWTGSHTRRMSGKLEAWAHAPSTAQSASGEGDDGAALPTA